MQNQIPLGYQIKNGRAFVDREQKMTVLHIFVEYGNGKSLNQIAGDLMAGGRKKANGRAVWRHPAIGRILQDKKYLGDDFFPPIIDRDLFDKAQAKRQEKMKMLGRGEYRDGHEERILFEGKVICGVCGKPCRQYHDNHRKKAEIGTWKCRQYQSQKNVLCEWEFINDSELLKTCTIAINKIICRPELLRRISLQPEPPNKECHQLDRIIEQAKNSGFKSKEELKSLLSQRATVRYQSLLVQDTEEQTKIMEEVLAGIPEQEEFNEELFVRLVRKIIVGSDRAVRVEFINQSYVRVEY